jgi:hypothetical protein
MVAYHYESEASALQLEHAGMKVARAGQAFALRAPQPPTL